MLPEKFILIGSLVEILGKTTLDPALRLKSDTISLQTLGVTDHVNSIRGVIKQRLDLISDSIHLCPHVCVNTLLGRYKYMYLCVTTSTCTHVHTETSLKSKCQKNNTNRATGYMYVCR